LLSIHSVDCADDRGDIADYGHIQHLSCCFQLYSRCVSCLRQLCFGSVRSLPQFVGRSFPSRHCTDVQRYGLPSCEQSTRWYWSLFDSCAVDFDLLWSQDSSKEQDSKSDHALKALQSTTPGEQTKLLTSKLYQCFEKLTTKQLKIGVGHLPSELCQELGLQPSSCESLSNWLAPRLALALLV
jgi:hypothetical protein